MNRVAVSPGDNRSFTFYLSGVGAGSAAMGLQIVLYPWLVVGILGESPDRVGFAQMAMMLPNLVFILWGGAASDARHLGSYLRKLYLSFPLPYGILLFAALTHSLNYWLVMVFGAAYGTIMAFVQPARESLLSQVTQHQLQQAVARSAIVQFAAQSIGIFAAGWLDLLGVALLAMIQMLLFALAGLLMNRSQPKSAAPVTASSRPPAAIRDGLKLVLGHRRLRQLMLLVAATGFLGFGAYLVVMPLLTREVYQRGPEFFAGLQLCFTVGVLLSNVLFIRWVRSLRRPGKMMLTSLILRGCLLVLLSLKLPFWLLFPSVLVWGMFSGISMTLGRAMIHEESPTSHRSRAVSVYQLCLFGSAPLGAGLSGLVMDAIGVLQCLTWLGALTIIAGLYGAFFSDLWRSRPEKRSEQP